MMIGIRFYELVMFGSEIEAILKKFSSIDSHFLGVKAIDTWPSQMNDMDFFISNASPANHKGTHWFFIGVNSESIVEVFDCLSPKKEVIVKAKKFRALVDANSQELMPKTSGFCGQYAIYYALHRHFNPEFHMMDILIEFFHKESCKNDKIVQDFLKEI